MFNSFDSIYRKSYKHFLNVSKWICNISMQSNRGSNTFFYDEECDGWNNIRCYTSRCIKLPRSVETRRKCAKQRCEKSYKSKFEILSYVFTTRRRRRALSRWQVEWCFRFAERVKLARITWYRLAQIRRQRC